MKKILVIDGNSIINRAFYGVRPLTTKSGKNTNAIYGMINIISKQMDALKPDYAAVAFDLKIPTFRHKMYEHYKEGRHPTPEDLLSQFEDAKQCLNLMGIHVMELPGYEADDIQGTVASFANTNENTHGYILSGDRDLLQLIGDNISVLLATNHETLNMGRKEFFEKYGIEPEKFVDMKALMGDCSDNIPGVKGIGEKTAATLIQNFGSLDGIYNSIEDPRISKGVREKLLCDKENAYLSKKLATIVTDAPIGCTLDELVYNGPEKAGLYKKFTELELNSFIAKFGLQNAVCESSVSLSAAEECFKLADSSDTKINSDKIALYKGEDGIYIYTGEGSSLLFKDINAQFSDVIRGREIICYDAKSLWHYFDSFGIAVDESTRFLDLMLYAYILNPGSGNAGIPALCSMFTGKSVAYGAPCPELMYEL